MTAISAAAIAPGVVADDVRGFQSERVNEVVVVEGEVEQVFYVVNAGVALESGVERGIDGEVLGENVQEFGPAVVSECAVEVEKGVAFARLLVFGCDRPYLDGQLFGGFAHFAFLLKM